MSKQSAQTISYLLSKCNLSKVGFVDLTGVSRTSLYKYLAGTPIHPRKAEMIQKAIESTYRIKVPIEKLID